MRQVNQRETVKLSGFMRLILGVLIAALLVILYPLMVVNAMETVAASQKSIPKVPFSETYFVCPIAKDVRGTDYKKGDMLFLTDSYDHTVGDKILLRNKYADKQKESIYNHYLAAVVRSIDDDGITVGLLSFENDEQIIASNEIAGKIITSRPTLGYLYQSMIGLNGYVFYGAVPIIIVILSYLLMKVGVKNKVAYLREKLAYEQQKSQMEVERIRNLPVPPQTLAIKEQITSINVNTNQSHTEEPAERYQLGLVINNGDTSDIEYKLRDRIKLINKTNPTEVLDKIYDLEEEREQGEKPPPTKPVFIDLNKLPPDLMLSADQIIDIYRKRKNGSKDFISAKENDEYEKLQRIAQMYYDSNIENY